MTSSMKNKGWILILLLGFFIGFLLKESIVRYKERAVITNKIDYFEISDERQILNDYLDYFKIKDGSDLPTDLKNYLTENIPKEYIWVKSCESKNVWGEEDFDFGFEVVDLNNDGEKKFILMPWEVCGNNLVRGASGNGQILVVSKISGKWDIVGDFRGNAYDVLKKKTNGYSDIVTHSHYSAFSGVETIYRWTKELKTGYKDQYEPIFNKWYRFDRSK